MTPPSAWDEGTVVPPIFLPHREALSRAISGAPGGLRIRPRLGGGLPPGNRAGLSAWALPLLRLPSGVLYPLHSRLHYNIPVTSAAVNLLDVNLPRRRSVKGLVDCAPEYQR